MLRPDLQVIASLITPNARVLDVGCGDGALLKWLRDEKQVDGRGIEINQHDVNRAISNGIPVIQGDVDSDLPHYPHAAYDYVILSQTLQAMKDPRAVLLDLVRIGKKAVVSVPNFGHWKNRFYLTAHGAILDIAVDIRPTSANFGKFVAVELNEKTAELLWIPGGFAHGFAVLGDTPADVVYHMDAAYAPAGESGIAFDDPALAITWPYTRSEAILSPRDLAQPSLAEATPHLTQWFQHV